MLLKKVSLQRHNDPKVSLKKRMVWSQKTCHIMNHVATHLKRCVDDLREVNFYKEGDQRTVMFTLLRPALQTSAENGSAEDRSRER